ncbi:MAG: efflux RND transporter periplasmic adaptor subunit [Planctomycetia bacterium]|nr:efflux RND transporter periplasmic adaptor subunit [Planctomycetia bacterium]
MSQTSQTERKGVFRRCVLPLDSSERAYGQGGIIRFFVLVGASAILALCGCRGPEASVPESEDPLVRTLVVGSGLGVEERTFPVFSKESQIARLSFRVPGQLEEICVKVGQEVAEGEVLARLDQRDYLLAIERIEKGLLEANAALKAMKTGARAEDIAALEAQIAAAQSAAEQAEKQFTRMENLRSDGTASEVQYDVAKTGRDMAVANHEALVKQLEKARAGARAEEIEMAEAKIAGLNIDLDLAKNALKDTELTAPFSGTIAEKFRDNHEAVVPGLPVFSLTSPNSIEASLSVPKEIVLRKEDIRKLECEFENGTTNRYPAELKELGQSVQQGNLAYPMTVAVTLSPGKSEVLPGMAGTLYMELSPGSTEFWVPTSALLPGEQRDKSERSAVWVVREDNTLEKRAVTTGPLNEKGIRIDAGLSPDDRIVSTGARFLKEGQRVRID